MSEYVLGAVESKFADLIWEHEPLGSGELVKLSAGALGWKKSTTYTVLKKLCERGIFNNENGTVKSLISKKELAAKASEHFVDEAFDGSLPAFVAAFTSKKRLTEQEVAALKALIDGMEET